MGWQDRETLQSRNFCEADFRQALVPFGIYLLNIANLVAI